MKRFLTAICCSSVCISAGVQSSETDPAPIVEARAFVTHGWHINYSLLADDLNEMPVAVENAEPQKETDQVKAPAPQPKPRASRVTAEAPAPTSRAKFDIEEFTRAQYATFRSGGSIYFKGRAGYLWETEDDHPDNISVSQMVNGLDAHGAVGFGAGYKLSNGERLEFEYTINKKDEKHFSVGYKF